MSGVGLAIDPSRLAGLVAFAAAALACLHAATRAPRRASPWRALAGVQLACALEVLLGWRYRLHGAFNHLLQERGWYESRSQWQPALLVAALVLAAAIVAFAVWRHRGDAAATAAIVGAVLGVSLFGIETISLHGIDAVMYAPAGPLVALAWMWIAVSTLVVVAAALAGRR